MTDSDAFRGHTDSVEDLQWSPVEREVFASCSVDQTVKIWDTRMKKKPALSFKAHDSDVNVISWNKYDHINAVNTNVLTRRKVSYLLASGADDGTFSVWDLRNIQAYTSSMLRMLITD
jgi:ribosome assembly protein RRB1